MQASDLRYYPVCRGRDDLDSKPLIFPFPDTLIDRCMFFCPRVLGLFQENSSAYPKELNSKTSVEVGRIRDDKKMEVAELFAFLILFNALAILLLELMNTVGFTIYGFHSPYHSICGYSLQFQLRKAVKKLQAWIHF